MALRSRRARSPLLWVDETVQPIVSLCITFDVGAVHEADRVAGISHLLEHLLFRSRSMNIQQRLQDMGAVSNAMTGKDFTSFFLTAPQTQLKEAVQVLHDIVYVFRITQEDLDGERVIVGREMHETRDPNQVASELLFAGSPYAKSIIGTDESLRAITLQDLRDHHELRYAARMGEAAIAAACPAACKRELTDALRRTFAAPPSPARGGGPAPHPPLPRGGGGGRKGGKGGEGGRKRGEGDDGPADDAAAAAAAAVLITRPVPERGGAGTGCSLLFRVPPLATDGADRDAPLLLDFLCYALAGELDTTWLRRLRRQDRLVYRLSMFTVQYQETGMLQVSTSLTSASSLDILEALRQCVTGAFLSALEFARVKEAYKLQRQVRRAVRAGPVERLQTASLELVYTGRRLPDPTEARIDRALTLDACRDMMRRIFMDGRRRAAHPGPGPDMVVLVGNNDPRMKPAVFRRRARDVFTCFPLCRTDGPASLRESSNKDRDQFVHVLERKKTS